MYLNRCLSKILPTNVQNDRGVRLRDDECRKFAKDVDQPKTESGLSLPDEVWFAALGFLCVMYAYGPQVQARLEILLPDLTDLDKRLAEDYEFVVAQRKNLR